MNFRTPGFGGQDSVVGSATVRDPRRWTVVAFPLLVTLVTTPALAQIPQGAAGGGVSSLFGQRTLGTASGPGRGLLGSSGGPGQSLSQAGNLLTGNERFLRGNQQGRFVGRDAAQVSELFRSLTGGLTDNRGSGPAAFGQGPRGRNRGQRRLGPGGSRGPATASAVRRPSTRLRIAFDHPSPVSGATVESLRSRLNTYLGERATGLVIDPELRERTLTLRGTVASKDDRALAERLAQLEPGVSHVENLLDVSDGSSNRLPQ